MILLFMIRYDLCSCSVDVQIYFFKFSIKLARNKNPLELDVQYSHEHIYLRDIYFTITNIKALDPYAHGNFFYIKCFSQGLTLY